MQQQVNMFAIWLRSCSAEPRSLIKILLSWMVSVADKCKRALDLQDKREPLTKEAYRQRVREVLRNRKAQTVAKNCAWNLKKVCSKVCEKRGAHSGK